MISVIIPILNHAEYTESILHDISINSVLPDRVIIINNGSSDNSQDLINLYNDKLNIRLLNMRKNIGVNAAWNLGMRLSNSKYIVILNNDLVLNNQFFEIIINTFEQYPKCGMMCPKTLLPHNDEYDFSQDIIKVRNHKFKGVSRTNDVPWRYGWAFAIRSSLKDHLYIPKSLFNYCGDDFQYWTLKKLGYDILLMENNLIFHYNAITGRSTKLRDKMFEDTNRWTKIKEELGL